MTNAKQIDEGFCFLYFRLSYRRKFIRTLWVLPIAPVILFLPLPKASWWFAAVLVTGLLQAGYNFIKWQAEVKNQQPKGNAA